MKTFIILILCLLVFSSCENDRYYNDINLKIISIEKISDVSVDDSYNSNCGTANGNYEILFETTTEPKLYRKINTGQIVKTNIYITDKWFYSHSVGDIVHFDYMLKSEFFEISPEKLKPIIDKNKPSVLETCSKCGKPCDSDDLRRVSVIGSSSDDIWCIDCILENKNDIIE